MKNTLLISIDNITTLGIDKVEDYDNTMIVWSGVVTDLFQLSSITSIAHSISSSSPLSTWQYSPHFNC